MRRVRTNPKTAGKYSFKTATIYYHSEAGAFLLMSPDIIPGQPMPGGYHGEGRVAGVHVI